MGKFKLKALSVLFVALALSLLGCVSVEQYEITKAYTVSENADYTLVNENVPEFSEEEISFVSYERYSDLDRLGRCGVATACIGADIMPTEERGSIGGVKPSGWKTVKYDIVDGKYLYNRCHLIAFQLTGENANEENLITGTRYFNVQGMQPFENMVADYVKETGNHVMYRVTPVFEGNNLVASGVKMEAYSVEDSGEGISFNVYVPNRQPGVIINYADGTSVLDESYTLAEEVQEAESSQNTSTSYVLNISSKKFHLPGCSSVETMKEKNRKDFTGTRDEAIAEGYKPCGSCKP